MSLKAASSDISTWARAHWRTLGAVFALIVAIAIALLISVTSRGCSSHDDVAQRVASLSEDLQRQASSGKMTVEKLAANIRSMNEVTTAHSTGSDYESHCQALDELRGDLALEM